MYVPVSLKITVACSFLRAKSVSPLHPHLGCFLQSITVNAGMTTINTKRSFRIILTLIFLDFSVNYQTHKVTVYFGESKIKRSKVSAGLGVWGSVRLDSTFKNQITSAGISIMNNISEGFCRNSDAVFRQFLNISKGSSSEARSMYYLAEDLNYTKSEIAHERRERCLRLINSTGRLMSYLKTKK